MAQNPRLEVDENPPIPTTAGLGLQFSLLASATLLVTPVIVAQASGRGDWYVNWMVFASLVVVGISTLIQARRIGPLGGGVVLPMFTAAFAIPFCITAVVGRRSCDINDTGNRLGCHPTCRVEMALLAEAHSHSDRWWHGDDDFVHHIGVSRF